MLLKFAICQKMIANKDYILFSFRYKYDRIEKKFLTLNHETKKIPC